MGFWSIINGGTIFGWVMIFLFLRPSHDFNAAEYVQIHWPFISVDNLHNFNL